MRESMKSILVGTSLGILALLVIRSNYHSSSSSSGIGDASATNSDDTQAGTAGSTMRNHQSKTALEWGDTSCKKIPASIAQVILHYTTSDITPQQTFKEISVSAQVLEQKSPCNFLVFGLGHDSLMWNALNHGGRTVFLEEDEAWMTQIGARFPVLESYKVSYDSKLWQAEELMEQSLLTQACMEVKDPRESGCPLALKGLPREVYETEWDLIMVDAPTGYHEEAPGRMKVIYTAGLMARNREGGGETDVFVHDVDRPVEDQFSKAFLCDGYARKQAGRIRHYTIPSHKGVGDGGLKRPFCPNWA